MKRVRRFLVKLLEDTEDDLAVEQMPPIPIPLEGPNAAASLDSIQNNHLYHLTVGHNQLAHVVNAVLLRTGRLEAKVGLILALAFGIFGLAAKPVLQPIVETMVKGLF
jgi:hypothetical protein